MKANKSAEQTPEADKSAEQTPEADKSAEQTPETDKSAEQTPEADKSAEQTPEADKSAEQAPKVSKPVVLSSDVNELYADWLQNATADPDLIPELESVKDDPAAIEDRFYRELEFGTAGIRGVIGAGTNRMNRYVIARATQGLADYVNAVGKDKTVAIAYDSRIKSDVFAKVAAEVLAANGIKSFLYSELAPVPMLSYAVRSLNCDAGVMVTASHNPAKYNGYKAYGPDGCQMTDEAADTVYANILSTDIWTGVKSEDFDAALSAGKISYIPASVTNGYFAAVRSCSIRPEAGAVSGLKVVYTPLNGAGNKPVRRILKEIGINDVTVVPEQENPDGNFPTCPFPNPEIREAMQKGLDLCEKIKPDLLLATDPDCDRMGIAVPDNSGSGEYALFSGNEVGALLLEYIAKERTVTWKMPKNPVAVKSLVSTTIADKIAAKYGVELRDVLTGFKWIGSEIAKLEAEGRPERFIFAFEESYGYLGGTYCRDKDAVIGSMLVCEMAAVYRGRGISLIDARRRMYEEYGFYKNDVDNFAFEGSAGLAKMKDLMEGLRANPPKSVAGLSVVSVWDYGNQTIANADGTAGVIDLPKSNVIKFVLENDNGVIVRPSGTEPKVKVYYTAIGDSMDAASALKEKMSEDIKKLI
ncbi:phosphoglucomutase [Clostridia bacterium]|nr:phosphoglucomutase [Clostridia bacterium]